MSQDIISYQSEIKKAFLFGVNESFNRIDKGEVEEGRFFTDEEDKSLSRVVVLGSKVRDRLFGEGDAVGQNIKINRVNYRVVGVMEERGSMMFFDWDDLGTWDSLRRVLTPEENNNVCIGRHVEKDTSNCTIYSQNQLIATFGVKDLIVVQAEGKLLVCHKEKAPFLKEIVSLAGEVEKGSKKDS